MERGAHACQPTRLNCSNQLMARWVLRPGPMKPTNPPKLSSSEVLEALGLQRRRGRGQELAVVVGLAAAGMLFGAGVVLLRAGMVSLSTPKTAAVAS